jgi:hypothetical protein
MALFVSACNIHYPDFIAYVHRSDFTCNRHVELPLAAEISKVRTIIIFFHARSMGYIEWMHIGVFRVQDPW